MEYKQGTKNRLKRIEGQIRGVIRMMEEGKECREIVTQLSASRKAIDRTLGLIVAENLEQCLRDQLETEKYVDRDLVKEAVELLVKSR
ncbi:metal-sensitive transcriptional regulator [Terrilactibacillus laevilacticus]|uniref:Metal-sensitive transcriptional regulator n=1 Tax=Terrilactibacillus laevilacticus TaxID=1380157 RepID=A0ABW5PV83_9BACI|nr:metal-sensitive transcriptional regulator [Terrilactibacillus laevilacticus]